MPFENPTARSNTFYFVRSSQNKKSFHLSAQRTIS